MNFNNYFAQLTQVITCGINKILPNGIGLWHLIQLPKSLSFSLVSATLRLLNFNSALASAAWLTDLLLIASIRDTLPIAFSGAIGFVNALYFQQTTR